MNNETSRLDLSELKRNVGEEIGFLKELLEMVRGDIVVRVRAVGEKLDTGDMEAVKRESHTLKGHAFHVGAKKMGTLASSFETAAGEKNRELCVELLPAVRQESLLVAEDIGRWLAQCEE